MKLLVKNYNCMALAIHEKNQLKQAAIHSKFKSCAKISVINWNNAAIKYTKCIYGNI